MVHFKTVIALPKVTQSRCALYARVSTKEKGQETENQLGQLREFAGRAEWTIVAEYIDHESGKIADASSSKHV